MKPLNGEIVNGTDQNGGSFSDATVVRNHGDQSLVRREDGSHTVADHSKIKGAAEPKKRK